MAVQWGDIATAILREGAVHVICTAYENEVFKTNFFVSFSMIQKKCEKNVIGKRRMCERIVMKVRNIPFTNRRETSYDRLRN